MAGIASRGAVEAAIVAVSGEEEFDGVDMVDTVLDSKMIALERCE